MHFSAKFKELFWSKLQEGKEARAIVIELGIDPDILGENRVSGLSITRKYGNKTYEVYVHFSETSKETMTDKIMRLIKNEINLTDLS